MNLRDYHLREGKRHKLLQLVFAAVAMIVTARGTASFDHWLHATKFAIAAALIGGLALRAHSV